MIVLHAARLSGSIWLWAEAPPDGATEEGNRRADETDPPRLSLGAGPDRLAEALGRAPGGFRPDPFRLAPLVAWLPARGTRPIASSPLVAEPPRGRGRLRLRPWTVTAVSLDLEESLNFFSTVGEGSDTLAPGLPVSPDVAFWARALGFAGRLVAGGHVVPGLVKADGGYAARWDLVFKGDDLEALASLCGEMPPAARALVEPGVPAEDAGAGGRATDAPPDASPLRLVRGFMTGIADHLVRSAQWPDGILPFGVGGRPVRGSPPGPRNGGRPVDERWLEALRAPDPRVEGASSELTALKRRLDEWRRPLLRILDAPWRLCFRLDEPGSDGEGLDAGGEEPARWRLRYLIQDAADPSLLIPLEDVWSLDAPRAGAFQQPGPRLREGILQALGQAARLAPSVDRSLESPESGGIELDGQGTHHFLREEAPLLREAGFAVRLPAWWTGERSRLKPAVRAVAGRAAFESRSGLNLGALVDVRWEVVLGGETVTAEELRRLAAMKASLVRLRGRWVEVDPEALGRALAEVERAEDRAVPAIRLARMALGAEEGPSGLPVEEVRAEGALGDLMKRLRGDAEFEALPPPEGLEAELRPYQRLGYSWLVFLGRWGLGACLADDMGLGKTVQTLALVQRDREESRVGASGAAEAEGGDAIGPVLVVCPTSVVTNWQREAGRFAPGLRLHVHHGPDRPSGSALRDRALERDLVITTYALLHRDADDLARVRWRGLVLDEAQNIKNPETRRARAARSIEADFRVALTGTPVENHVGDLWSIMEVLNPGLLGSRASFRKRFFLPIQTARDRGATERLRRITGPFILRRLKTDRSIIRDLPERIASKVYCTLTREQASLYAAVLRELEEGLVGRSEGIERKGLVLATLTRLKQVCNHPAHLLDDGSAIPGRSGKVERLVELLDEVRESGGRALIFTQYTRMGEILRGHLQDTFGREVPFLHGGVSRRRREEMVDGFQDPSGPDVFLLSLKAGGTGLNLTAANHVFLFDRWWNPAVEAQAADRAFRIGQRRSVQVHSFVCTGTLEEQIDDIVEGKRELARAVVGAGEGWLTELSDQELRDVLALRPGALDEDVEA